MCPLYKGDLLCPESLAALDRLRVEIESEADEAKEADVDAMRRLELTREIEELRERQKTEVDELVQEINASKVRPIPLFPPPLSHFSFLLFTMVQNRKKTLQKYLGS